MKKLLLAAVIAGSMSTSAIAATFITGSVDQVYVLPTGITVTVNGNTKYLDEVNLTTDQIKTMIAMLLTAQASGSQVSITNGGCPDESKWCKLRSITAP